MDKTTENGEPQEIALQIWPQEGCRFAYTLNYSQPVRCTWISDQPLFYSDSDEIFDEDQLSDDPILMALERDIADLREKTVAYDRMASDFVQSEDDKLRLFAEDADFVTAPRSAPSVDQQPAFLGLLEESRYAAQMLGVARLNGVALRLSNQVMDASYDFDGKVILVREDLNLPDQALLAVRELRRMYQKSRGAGIHPLALHPDYAVIVNRAQIADLAVGMIRAAWEMQLMGHKSVWERIENSPMADLGRSFAREAMADFRSIQDGTAARVTFESWFLSERCRRADRLLIQQMLADYQGYSFSDHPETSRVIALELLKVLGDMPFGQNYTASVAAQILIDPVFTDVRDRSNANFLWFIKFERSFVASERQLRVEQEKAPARPTADVISFPAGREFSAGSDREDARESGAGRGEIIPLYRAIRDF